MMNIFSQPIAMAETMLANSPAGILVYEGDTGNCALANQAVADMLGESIAALRLQNFRALASWRQAGLDELAEAALHDGLSRHQEVTLHNALGKIVSLECFISRFDVEDKAHLMIIVADITVRKQAQEKLARERALLRCLFDSISDLIFIKDREGVYRGCNKAGEAFIRMPEDEQIGKTDLDFFDREKAEEIRKADRRVLEDGKPLRIEEWVTGQDGRRLLMDTLKAPYYDPDGEALGLVGISRDITERRRGEQERLAHLRFLESMDRVNRAIQCSDDLETMMRELLDVVLAVFGCDRAFLLYPCDPEAQSWHVPMERNKPAYPDVRDLKLEMTMDPQVAETLRILRAANGPVAFGPGTPHALPENVSKLFGIKCFMSMAVYPKTGSPWQFGIHQCDSARIWTAEEERLFQEIGRRLADGLNAMLAEAALRKSKRKLREAVRIAHVGYWERDYLAQTIVLSEEACKIFGLPPHYCPPKLTEWHAQWVKLIHPEDRQRTAQAAADALAGGPPYDVNYRVVRSDGEVRYVRSYAEVTRDASGNPLRMFGTMKDITKRRRSEEKMLRSDQRLRLHREQSPLGFLEWDENFHAIEWNDACERIFGYTREEAIGRHAKDLILPVEVHDLVDGIFQSLMNHTGGQHSINENVTKDGRIIICEWFNTTLIDKDGKAIGIASVCNDITEQKRMEMELAGYREHLEEQVKERTAELETARNKSQQYLDIAGVILVAIDKSRRVTLINQRGCDVLGYPSKEIIGKDWFDTFVPENARLDVLQGFRQLISGRLEPIEYFENSVLTRNGRERLVAWHSVLLRDMDGNISGTLSSGEDITERKRAEKQIIKLNQDLQNRAAALQAANKELDAFAYSVSHDLRAPLRHINGFLELLQKRAGSELDGQSRHYMNTISDAANKMGLLIDDLLSFSRMGRHAMSFQPVELEPLVRDVIRDLEPDVGGRIIEWRIGDLPAVSGDAAMLRMVMANLISNALKFTLPRQQTRIEIGSLHGQDSETVVFVRDNGVGFDMTYADKLFGVFQRLHRADEFEGTGIGLASVRRIIARHGGRTWAEGEVDRGATFYFSLPQT